jgi:hypothetical protein
MLHSQPFIESLIELRSHYQSLINEHERQATRIREQLSRVNALLVDQLIENQQFVDNLMELRSHCRTLLEEQQQKAAHLREQMNHVNALLTDQVTLQHHGEQPVSIQAASIEQKQQQALTGAIDGSKSEQVENSDSESPSQFPPLTTPLLLKYSSLTKNQAVEKLLQEKKGNILHIDYIIRTLYGELSPDETKAEKPRMYDTLKKGVAKGQWDSVPDSPGCYTINLKLIEPELDKNEPKSSKHEEGRRISKSPDEMLDRYRNLSLIEAVEQVVQESAGQILTTEKVAQALYGGKLEGYALTKAKERIGKTLWYGARQGFWQRVPQQLGCYKKI